MRVAPKLMIAMVLPGWCNHALSLCHPGEVKAMAVEICECIVERQAESLADGVT